MLCTLYRSWGFRLIGGMDEGLVLKIDKATNIIIVITIHINVIIIPPKKINKNLQWQNRCSGWGPLPPMLASRQEMFLSRLNFISDADDYWTSFQTLNNEHWALFQMLTNEQRVKTTMMFDADQLRQFVRRITLPPNFTSSWSRWWSWSSWCWCRWRASWSPCWPTPRQSSASGHPMWMRNFNSNLNAGQDQANGGTEHEYSFKGSSRSHFEPEGATWGPCCSKVSHPNHSPK